MLQESTDAATQRLYRKKLLPLGDAAYLSVVDGIERVRTGFFAFQVIFISHQYNLRGNTTNLPFREESLLTLRKNPSIGRIRTDVSEMSIFILFKFLLKWIQIEIDLIEFNQMGGIVYCAFF